MHTKDELVAKLRDEMFGMNFVSTLKHMTYLLQKSQGDNVEGKYQPQQVKDAFEESALFILKYKGVSDFTTETVGEAINEIFKRNQTLLNDIFGKN